MYNMIWDIKIGDYKLGLLESVEIHKSVDLLADTAIIKVPGVAYNQSLDLEEKKVKTGSKVIIKLGYEETGFETEFEGYLYRMDTDDNTLTFNCEDNLYLTRKHIRPKVFNNVDVKTIAQYLVSEIYLSFDGYEGSITGWLISYIEPGYSAEIRDKEYEYKTGTYYVVSVTTTFSENGGVRKIELGLKLTGKKGIKN